MDEALIDNDVVIAMARYDLMTEFDTILRGKCCRPLRCCPVARFSLRLDPSKSLWKAYPSNSVRDRVKTFIDACKPIPNKPGDAELLAKLLKIQGVNDGEAALIEYAIENPKTIIITGDQHCTFAIAGKSDYEALRRKLAKRVVHMECLFESMHNRYGIQRIRKHVIADRAAHKGLTNLLGDHHSDATARSELSIRIQEMDIELRGMLIAPF